MADYSFGSGHTIQMQELAPRRKHDSERHPPTWTGHRTFLSIAADTDGYDGLAAFTRPEASDLVTPDGLLHAWLIPLLWCAFFTSGCHALMGPYLPHLARSKYALGISETAYVFAINRGATAVGALFAYGMINKTNGAKMVKSATGLAGACFVLYGTVFYLKSSQVVEYRLAAAILYGTEGFCYAFFALYTLTTLFYHYGQQFRLYICMFEFMHPLGASVCLAASFYVFQELEPLPFFIIGGCLIFGATFACIVGLDRVVPSRRRSTVSLRNGCRFLGDVSLILDVVTIGMAWMSIAYLDTYLYANVTEVNEGSSVERTVFLFVVFYGAYAAGILLFGTMGFAWHVECLSAVVAQALAVVSFAFGMPVLHDIERQLDTELFRTQTALTISMVLLGLAVGGQTVPMMRKLYEDIIARGFARTIWTTSSLALAIVVFGSLLACGTTLMTGLIDSHYGRSTLGYSMLGINFLWLLVRSVSWLLLSWLVRVGQDDPHFSDRNHIDEIDVTMQHNGFC